MFSDTEVIFVEDDPQVRGSLVQTLELAQLPVVAFASAELALQRIRQGQRQVVITDVRLPGIDGLQFLERVKQMDPGIPVVIVTGHGDIAMAVSAMRSGAYDFMEKPFPPERFVETARRALEMRTLRVAVDELRTALSDQQGIAAALIGRSPVMDQLRRRIVRLASTDADVIIHGETGTGKELVARCLHDYSVRRDRNFVAINCGGLPESLFESELFGHEPGAFTSAGRRRVGKFEHAHGGTLMLDEIETMPVVLQIKLLRVLQERRIERLGSNQELQVDVRVVAATKSDLLALSEDGRFRSDLYYRLNVAELRLPPLRERREDVPLLFQHFVRQAVQRYGLEAPELSCSLVTRLLAHDWPGNVRELRNFADRFVLESGDSEFRCAVPDWSGKLSLSQHLEVVEKALIERALARAQGNVQRAMEELGLPKKTLYDKVHRHGIVLEQLRESIARANYR